MRNVLVVDDDTIIRITLRSLIEWEAAGYRIVADAIHGEQALVYLKDHPVDLVITDMKMPVMDGLGLLEAMNRMEKMPKVLVLSGYDDFQLVREAFRLGASDYLLKADLNEELLGDMLKRLEEEGWEDEEKGADEAAYSPEGGTEIPDSKLLADMAMGKRALDEEFFCRDYLIMQFEIEDFLKHSARFGENFEEELIKPMLEFAGQIPRVASRCILGVISPSRYVLLYSVADPSQYTENAVSTCRQLCSVWNNYMNLPVSAGISHMGNGSGAFIECFEEAGHYLSLHHLKGKAQLCHPWEKEGVTYEEVVRTGTVFRKLLQGVMIADELVVQEEKKRLFSGFYTEGWNAAKNQCLHIICNLAWLLEENHDDINALFPEEINYYQKLNRLEEIRNLELWLNNYFRWIMDYVQHNHDHKQADMMIRAKRFIMDNYSNPELTLGSVAGYVGLNEKYFSTRFTKEEGMTFINYLTDVRIRKARELMEQTDLKIYEISQNVGYNSVEHFTRVFKKMCKVSPGAYRK